MNIVLTVYIEILPGEIKFWLILPRALTGENLSHKLFVLCIEHMATITALTKIFPSNFSII